ncbi:hypothetical protein DFQ27_002282 [Actinomortierella ambigua]|uniref:Uncharacterized protein n=1 Tax=Actinomortierella ambigua TaxID=1343610 RepID=A0A9P6Q829_9FUNG|nr:hypothetical protein DFQ27_002282 [Actinomortierella ambigua]
MDHWRQLVVVLRSIPFLQLLYLGVADRPPVCSGPWAEDEAIFTGGFTAVARSLPRIESVELTGFGGIQASEIVAFLDHCPRLLSMTMTIRPLILDWPTTKTMRGLEDEREEPDGEGTAFGNFREDGLEGDRRSLNDRGEAKDNARSDTGMHAMTSRRCGTTQDIQNIGGDAALATSRSGNGGLMIDISEQQSKRHLQQQSKSRRRTFYHIQRLGLYTPMLEEVITPFMIALMPRCPDLKSLMVPQLENESHLFRFCDVLRSTCHSIEWLSFLGFLEQPDRNMAAILRALPPHQLQEIILPTMTVGDDTLAAVLDHQSLQLRRLNFLGSAEGKVPSRWVQQMLTRAVRLEVLIATRFTNMLTHVIVLDVEDALLSDWQCLQLEQLDIAIRGICHRGGCSVGTRSEQQRVSPGIGHESDEGEQGRVLPWAEAETGNAICSHHDRCMALQHHVYWQLGRLRQLQQLTLVSNPAGGDGLELQLGKGLEQLQGLTRLVWLYVGGNLATMRQQEVAWIRQVWPRFRAMVAQVDQRGLRTREVETMFREHCPQVDVQVST